MMYQFVDAHCHPNLGALQPDQAEVIARMKEAGILGIVVGVDEKTSRDSALLAERHDNLYACIGLHPNDTPDEAFDAARYTELIQRPKVVGVGECGLDYYRLPGKDKEAEKARQWDAFKAQVHFALEHDKPLMIHCRPSKGSMDAYEEMLAYLEPLSRKEPKLRGNMHFFVGNLAVAERFWTIGFTTSFTGVLTFTHDYDEVVREAPLNMILTETDAPYAAPVPHRGKRNEPAFVPYVIEAIARIRGIDEKEVAAAVRENAARVFGV